MMGSRFIARAQSFAERLGIRLPVLLAPMAGASPPSLSIAVANAGGLGACGALLMGPEAIEAWVKEFRLGSKGEFQLNLWVPDPPAERDDDLEARHRAFLSMWGPPVAPDAGESVLPDFEAQCAAMLAAKPLAISSIMGLYAPEFVAEMKSRKILWLATGTTVDEAKAAEAAGADAILAQGMEAGGHRGAFRAAEAESGMVGLIALVPQVVDAVSIPVIATGGIADARGVAAALALGASAVQIGTAFLRSQESSVPGAYAQQLEFDRGSPYCDHARLYRKGRAGHRQSICKGNCGSRCLHPGSVSSAARADARHARASGACRRYRTHADVGWAIGKISEAITSQPHHGTTLDGGVGTVDLRLHYLKQKAHPGVTEPRPGSNHPGPQ